MYSDQDEPNGGGRVFGGFIAIGGLLFLLAWYCL